MDTRPNPYSPQDLHEGWETWVQQQQRYWHEWMEAGQLWLSWWVSTLPPVPWPPAGTVLPPESTRSAVPPAISPEAPASVAPRTPPARKPRAAAQRHH
jgi:hypothetical protein